MSVSSTKKVTKVGAKIFNICETSNMLYNFVDITNCTSPLVNTTPKKNVICTANIFGKNIRVAIGLPHESECTILDDCLLVKVGKMV